MTVAAAVAVTAAGTPPENALIASTGTCRVRHCAGKVHKDSRRVPHNGDTGQSTGNAMGEAVPAQKEAAARVISVVATLPIFPPRDHADGATLGRQGRPRRPELQDTTATANISHVPEHPTISRTRDPSRFETDGQAESPPLQ